MSGAGKNGDDRLTGHSDKTSTSDLDRLAQPLVETAPLSANQQEMVDRHMALREQVARDMADEAADKTYARGENEKSVSADRILVPILSVHVASLLCMCGVCGHSFLIEHEALDQERGAVDPAYAFGDCPECGEAFNAEAARFSASLES